MTTETVVVIAEDELPPLDIIFDDAFPFDVDKSYYVAGPMSGYPLFNYDKFDRACAVLRANEIKIESPHEIDHGEDEKTRGTKEYQMYIDAGLALLDKCQGIILLSGWPQSTGALIELNHAVDKQMPVYFYHEPVQYHDNAELICMNRKAS